MKRSWVLKFEWITPNAVIRQLLPSPARLGHRLCHYFVGPTASVSPASPYWRGSSVAGKVQNRPWAPCVHVSSVWAEGWRGWKDNTSGLWSHSLPRIPPCMAPIPGLSPLLLEEYMGFCFLFFFAGPQFSPQPALPLSAAFPEGLFLVLYTASSSLKYCLHFTDDPKLWHTHLSSIVLFLHHWQAFSPGPTHQTRGSPQSQCHPLPSWNFLGSFSSHGGFWPLPLQLL